MPPGWAPLSTVLVLFRSRCTVFPGHYNNGVTIDDLPDWERVLAAERHLQALVPGTVLVGGTAAALHAAHRKSLDGDHVLEDLRPRFDEVLTRLEAAAGRETSRVQRPTVILGRLDAS